MSQRARFKDESTVALLMELPHWALFLVLAALWLLGIVAYAFASALIPSTRGRGPLVGGGLATLYLAVGFWIGLGERVVRRRRLRLASNRYRLGSLTSVEFEDAVSELFRLQGYVVTENKRPDEEDGGVDLEIAKQGQTLLVQIKHKWADVGVKDLRELWGIVASEGADGGVFVTSSHFHQRAREFAVDKNLTLIDADGFLRKREKFLPPTADTPDHDPLVSSGFARHIQALTAPNCVKCGKGMVLLTFLTGAIVKSQYWGCVDYPACKSQQRMRPYLGEIGEQPNGIAATLKARWEIAITNRLRLRNPLVKGMREAEPNR